MPGSDEFAELYERLAHAGDEIEKLNEACKEFLTANADVSRFRNPLDGITTFLGTFKKPIPTALRSQAGMIVNELRSCLDAFACQLAIRNGSTTSHVYFPISKSEEIFKDDGLKKIRKLREVDQEKIAAWKPWKGGNDILWSLHEADRTRKHLRLSAHGCATEVNVDGLIGGGGFAMHNCIVNGARVDDLEIMGPMDVAPGQSVVLARGRLDAASTANFQITYSEPPELEGKPVIFALRVMRKIVQDIISQF